MIITPMDCFYIFMIGLIVTGLIIIEIQIHTLKSTVEKYIDVRLHKDESLKKLSEKHLTK
jgi:hypothetical protein